MSNKKTGKGKDRVLADSKLPINNRKTARTDEDNPRSLQNLKQRAPETSTDAKPLRERASQHAAHARQTEAKAADAGRRVNPKASVDGSPSAAGNDGNQPETDSLFGDMNVFGQNMLAASLTGAEIYRTWLTNVAPKLKQTGQSTWREPHLDPLGIMSSWQELWKQNARNPDKWLAFQTNYNQRMIKLWLASMEKHKATDQSNPDVRSSNEDSAGTRSSESRGAKEGDEKQTHSLIIDFIRRSYALTSDALESHIEDLDEVDDKARARLKFMTKRTMEAISPNNFIATNPELLRTTVEEKGANLVRGFNNMLEDLYRGGGQKIKISRSDDSFVIGENVANTPGSVIFRNDIIELIQYTPTTETVVRIPMLIVPPWINKYYILDLNKDKSFIRWCVGRGLTVFCVSWVNPDSRLKDRGGGDYMQDGIIKAMEVACETCNVDQVHAVGYCMGGTLLSATASWLSQDRRTNQLVASLTLLATLIDFEDSGEINVYLDKPTVDMLDRLVASQGYLDSSMMDVAFASLRAQDLIWDFVVRNYLFGKTPPPFDLLYWNNDGTRNTAEMYRFLIHSMYLENRLSRPFQMTLKDRILNLSDITAPAFILAAKEDHIAPWHCCLKTPALLGGKSRFVLTESGHIAGVVNAPQREKYGWWSSDFMSDDPEKWLSNAQYTKGSWWMEWCDWLTKDQRGVDMVPARACGSTKYPELMPAPGQYVLVKSETDLRSTADRTEGATVESQKAGC